MRGWANGYINKGAITTEIKKTVVKEDPDLCYSDILVNWLFPWKVIKYPGGRICKASVIVLRAPGYRPRKFSVEQEQNKHWQIFGMGYV